MGSLKFNDYGYAWPVGNFARTVDADLSTIGFHGGLGLEFKMGSKISFFIEAQFRYAEFSEMKGNYHYTFPGYEVNEERFLYHYIYTGPYYTRTILGWSREDSPPSLPTYSDIRKAIFDLTGAAVRVGFMIHL